MRHSDSSWIVNSGQCNSFVCSILHFTRCSVVADACGFANSPPPLSSPLSSPLSLFSTENLLFWNAARDYRLRLSEVDLTVADEETRHRFVDDACNIWDDYICTTAPLQVNISGAIVSSLKSLFEMVKADPGATIAAVGGLAITTPVPRSFNAAKVKAGLNKDTFKPAETEIYGLVRNLESSCD